MMIVLYILLFIVCLSVLIMIHELGHLAAAKAFNVYCFEYSIGMGPALFRKKRKNGETFFALRAFPFGGFVSMYGEGDDPENLPDGVKDIPEERALNKIKKWKRAIILLAGVTMNAVLALVLFFVASFFPQKTIYLNYFQVKENSVAYNAGIKLGDFLMYEEPADEKNKDDAIVKANNEGYFVVSMNSVATYQDSSTRTVAALINTDQKVLNFKTHSFDNCLLLYEVEDNQIIYSKEVTAEQSTLDNVDIKMTFGRKGSYNEETGEFDNVETVDLILHRQANETFEESGLDLYLYVQKLNFGQMLKQTFVDFGNSSVVIVKAVGGLFIGKGWSEIGGIISIYTQTTSVLNNFGAGYFIKVWGIISVNLAIMNLLPFPGLDGWQLLVLIVEATAHKEIPQKVKSIISVIGISLLLILMVAILVKDIIGLF